MKCDDNVFLVFLLIDKNKYYYMYFNIDYWPVCFHLNFKQCDEILAKFPSLTSR